MFDLLKSSRVSVRVPESGADPTIESDSGFNAMDMAVAMGHRNGTCTSLLETRDLKWRQMASTEMANVAVFVSLSATSDGGAPAEVAHGNPRISSTWPFPFLSSFNSGALRRCDDACRALSILILFQTE